MRHEISIVAGPREWGDTRESWLNKVTRKVEGVTFRTVQSLWYGQITNPNHLAAIAIRRKAAEIERFAETTATASAYTIIAERLHAIDQDMHREAIASYLNMARELRDLSNGR